MKHKKLNIAVSGLNNVDSPGSGIPVIRALRESHLPELHITGLSYDAFEPGIYMHQLIDHSYQIPFPSAGQEALLKRLKFIQEREKIDVLIPNFDAELFSYIRLAPRLKSELGIHTFLPDEEAFEERQKANLGNWGEKHDIPVPRSKSIMNIQDIPDIASEWGYPLVVKGKYYDAAIVYSQDQTITWFHKISAKWGLPVILQQFISGTEVNVTALGDGMGGLIGAVPMRKQVITDKGKAWAGVTLDDIRLLDFTRKLMQKTRWRGPCELEMIRTPEGKLYLIEMNPRFPAWIYLACSAGQNHPEALVKMALGEIPEPFNQYESGKMFIRYSWDMIVDMKAFEQISVEGELKAPESTSSDPKTISEETI